MQPVHRKLILTLLTVLVFPLCFDPNEAEETGSKHFVLVHGAWCWYKAATLLRSSGHNPLRDVMEGLSPCMSKRYPKKFAVAVFFSALMPGPVLNVTTVNAESWRRAGSLEDSSYIYDNGPNTPPTAYTLGPMLLASRVYQLSPIQDWTLANMLMRPQRLFSDEDLTREITLSERNYGSVRRVAVISEDDKLIEKDFMLWMIERNPPDQVLEVKGSDHMVMMSKPAQLLALLQHIANATHI
ncbi:hypothetical protein BT93_I1490 [Corymbia citriodora subsp. variegata]|nr:hypothetical protein BT93_I1490 [Corymbia citriodora subsp. variegata]